ncbi:MAG: pyruvate kinase [Campylobacterales bacterium]
MRKAKIVATLGPSSWSHEKIEELIKAGVNVFRLNFSHGDRESHKGLIKSIREIATKLGSHTAILQDISGPKIRIGQVDDVMYLKEGDEIKFQKDDILSSTKNKTLCLSHPEIINSLEIGSKVYMADGTIKTEVVRKEGDAAFVKVLVSGKLTSRKGVNFPGVTIPVPTITKKDKDDLIFGAKEGVDIVALSFVRRASDVAEAREVLKEHNSNPLLFAKIEMVEAMQNIDDILEQVDGVMVARGDLGVELGLSKVPVAQKKLIKKANFKGLPVITATQMLISMINSEFPTRAEVSDIANAVMDGSDAVMLSDETAVGKYPIEAVNVLDETIREIEEIYQYYQHKNEEHPTKEAIALSASTLAETIDPKGIIVFSKRGLSALTLAKYRPKSEIIINSSSVDTLRKMSVVWGVTQGSLMPEIENSDELIYRFIKDGLQRGVIDKDSNYILTIGAPISKIGNTNLLRVIDRSIMEYMIDMFECSMDRKTQ